MDDVLTVRCGLCDGIGTLYEAREWCPACRPKLYALSVTLHVALPMVIAGTLILGFVAYVVGVR